MEDYNGGGEVCEVMIDMQMHVVITLALEPRM